jgi:toxin ParE1/3/4
MIDYILSNKAVEDLSRIWEYTSEVWSENQADKYYFMLLDVCRDLANTIVSGKQYPELGENIFGYRTSQHIIFYIPTSKTRIEVIRILHVRMDLKRRWGIT